MIWSQINASTHAGMEHDLPFSSSPLLWQPEMSHEIIFLGEGGPKEPDFGEEAFWATEVGGGILTPVEISSCSKLLVLEK